MDFKTYFINNCFSKTTNAKTITAHFIDGTQADYTTAIFDLLKSDSAVECITDSDTGEILYIK